MALARLGKVEHAAAMTPLVADADPVVAHTAVQTLALLGSAGPLFAVVDRSDASPAARPGALAVLQLLHSPEVVDGLLSRLERESNSERRSGLITALCRLYNVEGKWTGASWGTRPDTTGPYYQAEPWSESPKIAAALKANIDRAPQSPETALLLKQMDRHRVRLPGLTELILASAERDAAFMPQAVNELIKAGATPAGAAHARASRSLRGDRSRHARRLGHGAYALR